MVTHISMVTGKICRQNMSPTPANPVTAMVERLSSVFGVGKNLSSSQSVLDLGSCLPSVGRTFKAGGLSRFLLSGGHHTTFVIRRARSPRQVGAFAVGPPRVAGAPPRRGSTRWCSSLPHYDELCEVTYTGGEVGPQADLRKEASLAGAAPARPQLRAALRPGATHSTPPALRAPPTSLEPATSRIG